jgi:hypothetical protein
MTPSGAVLAMPMALNAAGARLPSTAPAPMNQVCKAKPWAR